MNSLRDGVEKNPWRSKKKDSETCPRHFHDCEGTEKGDLHKLNIQACQVEKLDGLIFFRKVKYYSDVAVWEKIYREKFIKNEKQ